MSHAIGAAAAAHSPQRQSLVRAFQRWLHLDDDPFAVFCRLTRQGRAPGAMFFETDRDGVAQLVVAPALTLTAHRDLVTVAAPLPSARVVLAPLAELLAGRGLKASFYGDALTVEVPFATSRGGENDEERDRLRAPSALDVVRALAEVVDGPSAPPLLGAFSYDLLDAFESLPALERAPTVADVALVVPAVLLKMRPGAQRATVISYGFTGQARDPDALGRLEETLAALHQPAQAAPSAADAASTADGRHVEVDVEVDVDDAAYEQVVRESQALIREGEVFQIVPSRTFRTPCTHPAAAFAALRRREQAPYRFFVVHPDGVLLGASPEAAFTASSGRVRVTPLAGTRPRATQRDRDDRMQAELLLDDKERAEHMMLVDLARNDVARVSRPGSRRVTRLLEVERFARVMHLVSEVEGDLDEGLDALHALRACMHAGTLVGAPKVRAAQHLRRLERGSRGLYGGAVGRIGPRGDVDVAIVIRSAFVREGVAEVRAGAGVVLHSQPAAEAAETRAKAASVLSALAAVGEGADRESL